MTEHEWPFLRALLSAPDDLTSRLVYADWLDDRGETTRAEQLRVWAGQEAARSHGADSRNALTRLLRGVVRRVALAGGAEGAPLTEDHLPFLRAILASPRDQIPRLVYAAWLESRGATRCAKYVRLHVGLQDPANTSADYERYGSQMTGLLRRRYRHWCGLVEAWGRDEDERPPDPRHGTGRPDDADLKYGPCVICGRAENFAGYTSRMPCEWCGRVLCWECADTGVHGSIYDFELFVTGPFSRPHRRLGSDSCPFCQRMDWMRAHGG